MLQRKITGCRYYETITASGMFKRLFLFSTLLFATCCRNKKKKNRNSVSPASVQLAVLEDLQHRSQGGLNCRHYCGPPHSGSFSEEKISLSLSSTRFCGLLPAVARISATTHSVSQSVSKASVTCQPRVYYAVSTRLIVSVWIIKR